MIKVAPSILSADYVNLQRDIEMVEKKKLTKFFQITLY